MKIKNVLFITIIALMFVSPTFADNKPAKTGSNHRSVFSIFHKHSGPNPSKFAYDQGAAKEQTKAFKKAADAFNKKS